MVPEVSKARQTSCDKFKQQRAKVTMLLKRCEGTLQLNCPNKVRAGMKAFAQPNSLLPQVPSGCGGRKSGGTGLFELGRWLLIAPSGSQRVFHNGYVHQGSTEESGAPWQISRTFFMGLRSGKLKHIARRRLAARRDKSLRVQIYSLKQQHNDRDQSVRNRHHRAHRSPARRQTMMSEWQCKSIRLVAAPPGDTQVWLGPSWQALYCRR